MKNRYLVKTHLFIFLVLFGLSHPLQAEFGTLFTTASERKVIDDNRYVEKRVKVKEPKVTSVAKIEVQEPKKIIYELVTNDYKVSGISISQDGIDSAWINGDVYQHGEFIEPKTQIKINASQRTVRFTVKGGKTFYGKSGDTVTVKYNKPITD